MRRIIIAIGLEAYAVALALLQSLGHIRTDEAKYLLSIPYPHPPLIRGILSLTDSWEIQEILWRIVFATLVVQAVWLAWDLSRNLRTEARLTLCAAYLLCGAVVFQAGSIMMAPLTGLQGLLLVWLYRRGLIRSSASVGWLALLWLASLFTAYQALLYFPLVSSLLRRSRAPYWQQFLVLIVPPALAFLYALSNPLILASFLNAGTDNAAVPFVQIVTGVLETWLIGGSVVLTMAGIFGMIRGRQLAVIGSFVLLTLYVSLSLHHYYAILFTPLFLVGSLPLLEQARRPALLAIGTALGTLLLWSQFHPTLEPDPTRAVLQELRPSLQGRGLLLIAGPFGHDWQYESPLPVAAYDERLLARAAVIVCTQKCPEVNPDKSLWQLTRREPRVWVRK